MPWAESLACTNAYSYYVHTNFDTRRYLDLLYHFPKEIMRMPHIETWKISFIFTISGWKKKNFLYSIASDYVAHMYLSLVDILTPTLLNID